MMRWGKGGEGKGAFDQCILYMYCTSKHPVDTCTCMKAHLWFVSLNNSPNRHVEGNIPQCHYGPVYIYVFDNVCVHMYCTFCMHEVTYTVYGQVSALEKYV